MSTPIKCEDIRKGDRIRMTYEYTATTDGKLPAEEGESYELIERPVQLPTEPGFYMTASSAPDVFQLYDGEWYCGDEPISAERVRHDGGNSLTLLRPVAEVAAEVLADVLEAWPTFGRYSITAHEAVSAKWATK